MVSKRYNGVNSLKDAYMSCVHVYDYFTIREECNVLFEDDDFSENAEGLSFAKKQLTDDICLCINR